MAQWENKEETTELKAPATTLSLCINNCGLPGNPTTKNMCEACFKASVALKEPLRSCSGQEHLRSSPIRKPERAEKLDPMQDRTAARVELATAAVNSCAGCRRKVGLAGFRCRCGDLFCGEHRYSDRHGCRFDYKKAGREAIARENPVYKATKIVRF